MDWWQDRRTHKQIQVMDYDGPLVYSETSPIARKSYRCCECGGVIAKGMKHIRFSGLWDGEWRNYRTCCSCDAIRAYVAGLDRDNPGAYVFGTLLGDLREYGNRININLLLTVLYNGGIAGVGKWSMFNEGVLNDLYSGKTPYEVIPNLYPFNLMSRYNFRHGFSLMNSESECLETLMKGEPLLCVAECGVFELLSVIKTAEELSLFTDSLDTRPKQFFTIHPGYLATLRKEGSAIMPSNTL